MSGTVDSLWCVALKSLMVGLIVGKLQKFVLLFNEMGFKLTSKFGVVGVFLFLMRQI